MEELSASIAWFYFRYVLLHFTSHVSDIKSSIDAFNSMHFFIGDNYLSKKKKEVMCFFTEILFTDTICSSLPHSVNTRLSKDGYVSGFLFSFSCLLHGLFFSFLFFSFFLSFSFLLLLLLLILFFFFFFFLMFYLCLIATNDIDYGISLILYNPNDGLQVCVLLSYMMVAI